MASKMKVTISTKEFKTAFGKSCYYGLKAVGECLQDAAREKAPENTGNLKSKIEYEVHSSTKKVLVGSTAYYARWQEFGSGIYYESQGIKKVGKRTIGEGRDTPWYYETPDGRLIRTVGNKAKPFLRPALNENINKLEKIFAEQMRKGL